MKKLLLVSGIVLLAAGCSSATDTSMSVSNQPSPTAMPTQAQPTIVNTTATTSASSLVGDTSNASLNQSLNNVDTQMNGLNSDSASADSSISQQQAPAAQ